jgi:hypothetical protein
MAVTTDPPTDEMSKLEVTSSAPKGSAKRDALRKNEIEVQQMWEEAKVFETDAADDGRVHRHLPLPLQQWTLAHWACI